MGNDDDNDNQEAGSKQSSRRFQFKYTDDQYPILPDVRKIKSLDTKKDICRYFSHDVLGTIYNFLTYHILTYTISLPGVPPPHPIWKNGEG